MGRYARVFLEILAKRELLRKPQFLGNFFYRLVAFLQQVLRLVDGGNLNPMLRRLPQNFANQGREVSH